jgi:hypothetical protein
VARTDPFDLWINPKGESILWGTLLPSGEGFFRWFPRPVGHAEALSVFSSEIPGWYETPTTPLWPEYVKPLPGHAMGHVATIPPAMPVPMVAERTTYYPNPASGSLPRGYSVEMGFAAMKEGYRVSGPGGSYVVGYLAGADFPGEYGDPQRGEIMIVNAGREQRKGVGSQLVKCALNLMREAGSTKVVFRVTQTEGGIALLNRMIREGRISLPTKVSPTGTATTEHLILGRRR